MKTLIVIVGPTGVGKTALCLDLAQRLDTVIINADSRQIYKEIPIGTAAPTKEEQDRVKHFFVGNLHIGDYYNAAIFENDVLKLLDKLFIERDFVVMSGGSMMYVDAVCNGIDDIPTINEETRNYIKERLSKEGLERLCAELKRLDPEYYDVVDKKNTRRVVHGLEICIQTGTTYTSFRKRQKKQRDFRIVKIGLEMPREELYLRINRRVDRMMECGLLQEAEALYPYRNLNALNTVGYKELFSYIDGTFTLEEAVERIKGNTRRYARKQMTWLKKDGSVVWFPANDKCAIMDYISQYG